MKTELSDEARTRIFKEIELCLGKAGFQTEPDKNAFYA